MNDQALAAPAAREPNLYERAGALVQVLRPQPSVGSACELPLGSPAPRYLPEAGARELLARHCAFVAPKGGRRCRKW